MNYFDFRQIRILFLIFLQIPYNHKFQKPTKDYRLFVVSYLLLMFIIPGGWLLDDCGVVYFEEASDFSLSGDITMPIFWMTRIS